MAKAKTITTTEADLLFAKILSKKNKAMGITTATTGAGRMEFNDFMVALAEISTKVYPDLEGDEALAKIMEEKVIPLAGK
mmetsp:Transcript_17861/g.20032  ORF Transcript_17861/g.20032 Transcript_17861/m.20032 type:complete len:80 (+) Transcript_17861:38-277(+)